MAHPYRQSLGGALREQVNIFGAVILRDLRTRFFNHGLGFLIVPLMPVVHLFALMALHTTLGGTFAYSDSPELFLATGLIPSLTFMYMSRMMSTSLVMNRPMLAYPIISILDVALGRAVLETMAAVWMAAAVVAGFYALGLDPRPHDPVQALAAFGMSVALAMSAGLVVSLISMLFETFATVWSLLMLVIYVVSGTFFVAAFLPEFALDFLVWNPVLHCVEWMRLAYYPGYPDQVLDKTYVLSVTVFLFLAGLLEERLLRRRLRSG